MDLALAGRLLAACAVIALVLAGLQFAVRAAVHARARGGLRGGRARRLAGGRADPDRASARGGRLVSVLETTLLPNASSLHVIRVADRYLVVGRSSAHIATLCELPLESIDAWRGRPEHA